MVKFIRKIFIKDYENIRDASVRSKHGVLAAVGGIFVNLLLFVFKLIIGLAAASMSIISDALNNLSDLFSCLVNLIGFKIAGKPADKKHPYGHERMEYIAGMIVSFVIICVAVILGYSSVMKLASKDDVISYSIWSFVILGGAIIVKLFLGLFYSGVGKVINSVALKASMLDSISDVVATTAVLTAAVLQFIFPEAWWLDGGMSIAVACFILYSGIKMTMETASPLVGLSPDGEFVRRIIGEITQYPGVLGVHDVICHSYGATKIFMTLHVEVDGYADTFESHDAIDLIETQISKKYGVMLTVHMDPIDTRNEKIPIIKEQLGEILRSIDKRLCFHDLRIVAGPTHTNLIFDIVLPSDIKMQPEIIREAVSKKVSEIDGAYNVVINIDSDYIGGGE